MHGRKLDLRWALAIPPVVLAAITFVVFIGGGTGEAPSHTQAVVPTRYVSQTLGSREYRVAAAPTLEQSLQAADLLVRAGKLAPPPTLKESLDAADLLVKAGKLAPPPSLKESLDAADLLVKAGKLAPPPSLKESLDAADLLVKAGKLAPPEPSLADALHAADLLVKAGAMPPPPWLAHKPADADAAPPAPPPASAPAPAPPPPPQSEVAAAATGPGGYYDDAFSAQVVALVNQRRRQAGLQPVAFEARLANSAAAYTKVLADNHWFSHTGPDGSTLVTRDEAAGFPFTVQIGEVLAWGSNGWTAAEIVQAWIDSPLHKEQILSPVYARAGAGCYFTREDTLMVRCAMEFAAAS